MLTQVIAQCAAAACATMSPQSAPTTVDMPAPIEIVASLDEANEEDPPASTRLGDVEVASVTDAVVEEETTVEAASAEDTVTTAEVPSTEETTIEMVSAPVVQPLDVEADIAALTTTPPVAVVTPSADDEEINCLALNIYHEARGEPERGRYAVAWVTVNRMQSAQFPDTVCEVVYQKSQNRRTLRWVAQFSWTLQNPAPPRGASWEDAQRIARTVYAQRNNRGGTQRLSSGVMYYHATSGVSQQNLNWFQRALNRVVTIGDHIFYRER